VPPRLTRAQIFVWTVEKYGRVNADILYYRKIANLVHARWGMGCVPSHGKTLGDERDLATIIKNRFENGRRSNAQFVYRNVPVSRINLCADGQQLVQQVRLSPGLAARGASLFLVRACSSANAPAPFLRRLLTTACPFATPQGLHVHVDQPDVDIADDSADDSATPAAPHVTLKPFNPARDARRALRSVYVGDPVLEDVVEVRATPVPRPRARTRAPFATTDVCALLRVQILDDSSHKALVVAGAWILLPTAWFEYMDTTAMPLFVTAQIVKKAKADRQAFEVKMIGDGVPSITVNYYVEKHPQAYAGMEERYLLNPSVKFLSREPCTM